MENASAWRRRKRARVAARLAARLVAAAVEAVARREGVGALEAV